MSILMRTHILVEVNSYPHSCITLLKLRGVSALHFSDFSSKTYIVCCGYTLEAPRRGASNEFPQHMFLWRNKKNIIIFWLKKK